MSASDNMEAARELGWERLYPGARMRITVGMGTCGIAAGAQATYDRLRDLVRERDLPIDVVPVGCNGACFAEPIVEVYVPGAPRLVYQSVDPSVAGRIFNAVTHGKQLADHLMGITYRDRIEAYDTWVDMGDASGDRPDDLERHPFFERQARRISSMWGVISPHSIEEYIACGGYAALRKAVCEKTPQSVIDEIRMSGLRGRGGAGFPAWVKWQQVADADAGAKYLIANADEGDPGAYMDRGLMESDPHKLIEGMAIAAYATDAHEGYVFTRAEYPGAVDAISRAIEDATRLGLIGAGAFDGAFDFTVRVVRSAGAYICGEEGALVKALEGYAPRPSRKPPYPSEKGLLDLPTLINNVETLANVPYITLFGGEAYRSLGTESSPGTKIFSLAGAVMRAGLVEVPMGLPLETMVDDIAQVKHADERNIVRSSAGRGVAVQIGGPSGSILPLDLAGAALDFDSLASLGAIMGSGGVVVLGEDACIVDTVAYFTRFSARASCGRCKACKDGLAKAADMLDAICAGEGTPMMLDELEDIAAQLATKTLCGLGSMAANPITSALAHYRAEFEKHLEGSCPSLICKNLMHFEVIEDACPGCLCCLPSCPTNAIKGSFGKPFAIDQERCIKCWMCVSQCPYPALRALPIPARKDASIP